MRQVFYSIRRRLHPVYQRDLELYSQDDNELVCYIRGWGKWCGDSELEDESVSELLKLWNDIKKDNQEFDIDFDISEKERIYFIVQKREQ
jgi:hypothetical protein